MIDFSKIRETNKTTIFPIPNPFFEYVVSNLRKSGKTFTLYNKHDSEKLKSENKSYFNELKKESEKTQPLYKKLTKAEPRLKQHGITWIISKMNTQDLYDCILKMTKPHMDPDYQKWYDQYQKSQMQETLNQLKTLGIDDITESDVYNGNAL